MDPLSLDWGGATAEFQNDEAKSAVHMFAHDLTTAERAERSLRFARARPPAQDSRPRALARRSPNRSARPYARPESQSRSQVA